MKFAEDKNWYKVGEVCQMVERSIPTINVWYDAEAYALENGIHFPFYQNHEQTLTIEVHATGLTKTFKS